MTNLFALIAGLVFGIGLIVSGMANPAKVLGFLDIAGRWDPSLAFVMIGAITAGTVAFLIARQRGRTLFGHPILWPTAAGITPRLVLGSAVFGIGWGLAGFCPGPALVALGTGTPKAIGFVAAMLLGMALFQWRERPR